MTPRVLLVNMPFGNLRWPNLGLSLLKAALADRGIGCDVAYFNYDFAERLGLDRYTWVADHFAFVLGGERLFAKHYFDPKVAGTLRVPSANSVGGDSVAEEIGDGVASYNGTGTVPATLPDDDRYWNEVLLPADEGLTEQDRRDFEAVGKHVEPFLRRIVGSIDWSRYAIVGFAATFQQTLASLCLARELKRLRPELTIVMGGSACEGPMGAELLRQFPDLDYVFLGEADESFPAFVEQTLRGHANELPPGVAGRNGLTFATAEGTCQAAPCQLVDLEKLPDPNFDDYFARWQRSPLREEIDPLLYFETSRGCWWGEKHHCSFCGLNGSRLVFRSKSAHKALDELQRLVHRYDVHRACSADNNLDPRYFDTLLPMLTDADFDLAFVYEMKTNLRREQVQALIDAGLGAAQLGIETFSTPILKLIGKGATAMQNLQALKWFSEAGIEVKWNMLYGFPGEPPEEYAALAELVPALVHLAAPLAVGRVRMDRFAPYYMDPERFGLVNRRPHRAFGYVYPFDQRALAELAYYFEFDFADGRRPLDYARPMVEAVEAWQAADATLNYYDRHDGVLIITDTRPDAPMFQVRMTGIERELYLFCDTGRTLRELVGFCQTSDSGRAVDEPALRAMLDPWLAARLAVCLDDRYLSLATQVPLDM